MSDVAIFWDYENSCPPSNATGLGYDIVRNISRIARLFGSVTTFRAYLDISAQSPKSVLLRSELQSSGVSMIDCPHNGRKDVVDKMVLVDMLAFAIDHPAPATIILITGDRDYAYAVSTLKLRKYQVILLVPSSPHTSPSLENQASLVIDWGAAILRSRSDPVNPAQAVRQPCFGVDANLVTKLLRELQDAPLHDSDPTCANASQTSPQLRRISTRDLLEPPRRCKDLGVFDATQELDSLASSRKSANMGNDPTLRGMSIPKTSRSRRASSSAGSTRVCSAAVVAPSPPVMERDTLVKNPPPFSAGRSSVSDITDVVGPAKRSSPCVPPLDTALELPLDDSPPPSSIVVRSPLETSRSIPASGSSKLNCLASAFVMLKKLNGSESRPESPANVEPASPFLAPNKTLSETVADVGETRDISDPKGTEHLNGVYFDGNDTNAGRSLPRLHMHSNHDPHDGGYTPKLNDHPQCAPRTIHFPSSINVGVHPTGSPPNKQVPPSAARVADVADVQFATSPRVALSTPRLAGPGSEPVLPSSAFPSTPPLLTTTPSHQHAPIRQRETWAKFGPLINLLLAARERGIIRPTRSTIALGLVQSCKHVYQSAGVTRFREYTALAEQEGIIELGGIEGAAWIALHPDWFDADSVASTSSPIPDPLHVIQSPLLASLKTSLIERTAIVQSPSFASLRLSSPENSSILSTLDGQDAAPRGFIPPQFQPLIDILTQARAQGIPRTLRSVVGQQLGQEVYARAGVSGFKEYVHEALEAQLVQFGGVGGHAWIRLHPDLQI